MISKEEKEKKRKKQKEYNEELKKQIEEKNKRKEMEKKKILEEDLKIEEKIKKQILEEQKELNLRKQQLKLKQQEEEASYNQNNNSANKTNINNNDINNNTYSSRFNPNTTGNNFYNNNNINTSSQSLMSTVRTNLSSNSANYNNNINRNNIKNYYMNFVQDQLGIIDEYAEKINNYNSSDSSYENFMNEKNEALKQIQISQNNFKNNLGFLPMNEQFNNKVSNIMDLILEQKVKEIKNNNNNINHNNEIDLMNEENKRSTGTFNLDNNAISEQKQIIDEINNNNFENLEQKKINNDIIGCTYKSKYEELKESILNGDDISNELKTSISLVGNSKFVVKNKLVVPNQNNITSNINDINLSDLYTTWDEQNFNNEINKNIYKNDISKKNKADNDKEEEEFKIEEIDNDNNEDYNKTNNIKNNKEQIIGDSSEDIRIKSQINAVTDKIENLSLNKNNNDNVNINDSYMDKVNEALYKNSQNIKITRQEKNRSILLTDENNNNSNINTYNPSICNNLDLDNLTEDFLNLENLNPSINNNNNNGEYPNYIPTKESQENTNNINSISNKNLYQYYNNIKSKGFESNENVNIGNVSLNNNASKNNSIRNSKNTNFNNTGKTNTLINEMKLIEEKDEEELYESEFKEDINKVKKIEEEENYENEFENEDLNEIKKLEEQEDKNKNRVNLDDYKEIHESQKIQSQLNFFEDSILNSININKSKGHIVGNKENNKSKSFGEKNESNNKNVLMSSELNDSYGDNILKNLNKYRKMALGESSLSQNNNE